MSSARDLLTEDVSVGEAIVRVLEEAGIDMVFGIPGGNTKYLFDALYDHRSTIRTVLVRHESLAGVMAEVYGRLTGRPGVALGQGAFMLTNALLGVLEAHLGSSPMVLLADISDQAPFSHHGPYQAGTGDYGTWDARQSLGGLTKFTFVPHHPAEAVQSTQLALKHALAGERGPVAVLYHSSAFAGDLGPRSSPSLYKTRFYLSQEPLSPSRSSVESAAKMLLASRLPVIIAGNGVRIARAYGPLQKLSEKIGAPVATTASGKGVFPEDHPLALGVMGNFGLLASNNVIGSSDVVLIVGSKLSPSDTAREHPDLLDPHHQRIIQIDIEPRNLAWTFPCDCAVIGDAALSLSQLAEVIHDLGSPSSETIAFRRERLSNERLKHGFFQWPEFEANDIPILPQRIIAELRKALAEDAFVSCDAGENRLFMMHYYQTKSPGSLLMPGSTGGMGYAIPAALAVKLLYPNRQAVAVCGDGGFAMSMNGLITAYEEGISIVTVIFNNSALGWVRHGQEDRTIASCFADINYAKVAQDFGCFGVRVEDPKYLGQALQQALECHRPAVIDIVTALRPSYREIMSPLVAD